MSKDAIRSQYHASLTMLQQVIERCPPAVWHRASDTNKTWHVALHALFYTHFYLQPAEDDYQPWPGLISGSQRMDYAPEGDEPPYSPAALLAYLAFCRSEVDRLVPQTDLEGESGFAWLPMSKFELQFYTIRHLQAHTGELAERLWVASGIEIGWVGMGLGAPD